MIYDQNYPFSIRECSSALYVGMAKEILDYHGYASPR